MTPLLTRSPLRCPSNGRPCPRRQEPLARGWGWPLAALWLGLLLCAQGAAQAAAQAPETKEQEEQLIKSIEKQNDARLRWQEEQGTGKKAAPDLRDKARADSLIRYEAAVAKKIAPIQSNIPKTDDSWANYTLAILFAVGVLALLVFGLQRYRRAR